MVLVFLPWLMIVSASSCAEGSPNHPILGAIRWDAWHGPASEVGLTLERTLAPAHWHCRLRFYGKKVGENAVEVRADTHTIMDQEIECADKAGLDYWAFVVYPEENALSLGLKLYLSSEKKGQIVSVQPDDQAHTSLASRVSCSGETRLRPYGTYRATSTSATPSGCSFLTDPSAYRPMLIAERLRQINFRLNLQGDWETRAA